MKSLVILTSLSIAGLALLVPELSRPADAQQRPGANLPPSISVSDNLPTQPIPTEPTLNLAQPQQFVNQFAETAKLEAITARIRQQEARDLLTSDYVSNPNYSRANAGQQFGEYATWENRYRYLNY
jgi:hypothetical protein